jgi:hypothetical protein
MVLVSMERKGHGFESLWRDRAMGSSLSGGKGPWFQVSLDGKGHGFYCSLSGGKGHGSSISGVVKGSWVRMPLEGKGS